MIGDPVAVVLGVVGLAFGVLAAEVAVIVGLREWFVWRARRRADRRVGPRAADECWAPVWEAEWPEK